MLGPTILGEIDLLDLSNWGVSCTAQTAVPDNAIESTQCYTSGVRPEDDLTLSLARRRPAGGLCECRTGHKRPPVEIHLLGHIPKQGSAPPQIHAVILTLSAETSCSEHCRTLPSSKWYHLAWCIGVPFVLGVGFQATHAS